METESSAAQMANVFQGLMPGMNMQLTNAGQKTGRRTEQDQENPAKRHRPRKHGSRGGQGHPAIKQEQVTQLISMVAAMSLQQEDALNRLRMDTSFTLHLCQEGPGAVLKQLVQAGQQWHQRTEKGEKLGPLRLVVFGLLLKETEARIKLLLSSEEATKRAKGCQWLDEMGRFVYQKWNVANKTLEVDTTQQGLTSDQVLSSLNKIAELATATTITKFNAKNRREAITVPDEGDRAVFKIEVAMRGVAANELHQQLLLLQDCAAWQLIGAQLRPPTLKRHGIAVALQKALENARE